jgi:hypothetical protein
MTKRESIVMPGRERGIFFPALVAIDLQRLRFCPVGAPVRRIHRFAAQARRIAQISV